MEMQKWRKIVDGLLLIAVVLAGISVISASGILFNFSPQQSRLSLDPMEKLSRST